MQCGHIAVKENTENEIGKMHLWYFRLLKLITVLDIVHLTGTSFLGGTVSWIPAPGNKVRFTYRTVWEKGKGPCGRFCSPTSIGTIGFTATGDLAYISWASDASKEKYTLANVTFVVTSVSEKNVAGWEQGENTVTYDVSALKRFTVTFSGFHWISASSAPEVGKMTTYVDTRNRNDTGGPNSSPFVSLPAYIGIPLGCRRTIRLPVDDPDKDSVKCRLATPRECGSACTTVSQSSLWIDQTNCTITVSAFEATGYEAGRIYRLSLVLEDFSDYPLMLDSQLVMPGQTLSSIPIQITMRVANGSCSQPSAMKFVRPTPANHATASVSALDIIKRVPVKNSFYVHVTDSYHVNVTEVMMSGPMHVTYSYLPDDLSSFFNRSNSLRVEMSWLSAIPPQFGNQQFCVWAVDDDGITSDERCITSIVADDADNCASGHVTCKNNGTCVNLFKIPSEKCVCNPGFWGSDCSQALQCYNNPCRNNGSCSNTKTGYSCLCGTGYTGRECESEIPPCQSSPCFNNATCVDGATSVGCVCSFGFTGTVCEMSLQIGSAVDPTTDHTRAITNVWIIAAAAGGAIIALVISLILMLVFYRQWKKNEVKPLKMLRK